MRRLFFLQPIQFGVIDLLVLDVRVGRISLKLLVWGSGAVREPIVMKAALPFQNFGGPLLIQCLIIISEV